MKVIAKRHRPLLCVGDRVLTCRVGALYLLEVESGASRHVCNLPASGVQRVLSNLRAAERLLRLEAKAAIALDVQQALVSYLGGVYRVNLENGSIQKEHAYRHGMNNPLYFADVHGVPGFEDCIAYGEYILNANRRYGAAVFMRNSANQEWKIAYEFPAGQVRHIHGLVPDKQGGCVYILTGDLDHESGVWVARDNFRTVEPLMVGAQKYRTGFWYRTVAGFVYPTDTALEQNYIHCAKQDETGQWSAVALCELDGSCTSAAATEDTLYIATTVEPDESVTGWRSWLNCRRGPGIKSKYAQLFAVDRRTLTARKLVQFKKDALPYKLFQYGSILVLPACDKLLVYPIGVKRYDGKLLILDEKSEMI